jgi:hypothetical protein
VTFGRHAQRPKALRMVVATQIGTANGDGHFVPHVQRLRRAGRHSQRRHPRFGASLSTSARSGAHPTAARAPRGMMLSIRARPSGQFSTDSRGRPHCLVLVISRAAIKGPSILPTPDLL